MEAAASLPTPIPAVAEVVPISGGPNVAPAVIPTVEPVVIPSGKISKREYIIAGLILLCFVGAVIYIASQNKEQKPTSV